MEQQLNNLLMRFGTSSNIQQANFFNTVSDVGYWNIPKTNLAQFWTLYCDNIAIEDSYSFLAENNKEFMPYVAHYNFRFNDDVDDIDTSVIKYMTYVHQAALLEVVDIRDDCRQLMCVVLMSAPQVIRNTNLIQLRFHFPHCRTDAHSQDSIIRPRVMYHLESQNVLSLFDIPPIQRWEDIYEKGTTINPFLVYGSIRSAGEKPLELLYILSVVDVTNNNDDISAEVIELSNVFDIKLNTSCGANPEILLNDNPSIMYWLPLFLSCSYETPIVTYNDNTCLDTSSYPNERTSSDHTVLADFFISIIDKRRWNNFSMWLELGKILHKVYEEPRTNEGLGRWIILSKELFDDDIPIFIGHGSIEDKCHEFYSTFYNSNLTINTLAWYAMNDNPDRYNEWHKSWCKSAIERSIEETSSHNIATVFYRQYWLKYACSQFGTSAQSSVIYAFSKHKWNNMIGLHSIFDKLSNELIEKYKNIRTKLSETSQGDNVKKTKFNRASTSAESLIHKVNSIISGLGEPGYKSSIIREITSMFFIPNFIDYLDGNYEFTGVPNGVIEVNEECATFRPGKPEDYITMQTKVPYQIYHMNHPLILELLDWFNKMFIDRDVVHYFLKYNSSGLRARNSDKIFMMYTGELGDNSKSTVVKLMECTWGSYLIKISPAAYTAVSTRKDSSAPTPDIARSKNRRWGIVDEAAEDVALHPQAINKDTGNDSRPGRKLYDNGEDIVATYKLLFVVNVIPPMMKVGHAVRNRARAMEFGSRWVDNAPESPEEQIIKRLFKKDNNFEKRLSLLAAPFLWLLCEYFAYYVREGMMPPEGVKLRTDKYWSSQDIYARFIEESIISVKTVDGQIDTSCKITVDDIYEKFKMWFMLCFPSARGNIPDKIVVESELSARWGIPISSKWSGITIRMSDKTRINTRSSN